MNKLKLIPLTVLILCPKQINAASPAYNQSVEDIKNWCSGLKQNVPNDKERSDIAQLIYHLLNSLNTISADIAKQINQEQEYFENLSNKAKGNSPALANAISKIKPLIQSSLEDSKNLLEAPIKTLSEKLGVLSDCYATIFNSLPDNYKKITLEGSKEKGANLPKSSEILKS